MKRVLITGACGGIGRAVVKKVLERGFGVWAVDVDSERLNELFTSETNVNTATCDLTDENAIKDLIQKIVSETGALSGLVHCAGFDKLVPIYLNKRSDVEKLFSIHVLAAMDLCKQLAKRGNATEGCSIVLISSLSAHEGAKGHTAYAAAKGAVEGFLAPAACELADKKIRINEVVLGVVQTQMSLGYIDKMDEEQKKALNASYPLGLGTPEDVAGVIAFLLSDEARWITGQKYILDGGHLSRKV